MISMLATRVALVNGGAVADAGEASAGVNTTCSHCGSCAEGVCTPWAHPKKYVNPAFDVTLNRGAPAPQCPPLRKSKLSSLMVFGGLVITAPAAEQSLVRPFFDRRRPKR